LQSLSKVAGFRDRNHGKVVSHGFVPVPRASMFGFIVINQIFLWEKISRFFRAETPEKGCEVDSVRLTKVKLSTAPIRSSMYKLPFEDTSKTYFRSRIHHQAPLVHTNRDDHVSALRSDSVST
jgi:hypothetical protein